jgi:hypothetical protein
VGPRAGLENLALSGFRSPDLLPRSEYSGPSSYDQLPHAGQGHLSYDPHGVRKRQPEPRYACLWT